MKSGQLLTGIIVKETPRNFIITMKTPGEARRQFIEHNDIASFTDIGEARKVKKFGKVKIRFKDGRPDLKLDHYSTTPTSLICFATKDTLVANENGKMISQDQIELLHFDVSDLQSIRWSKTSQGISTGAVIGVVAGAATVVIPALVISSFSEGEDELWQYPTIFGAMGAGVGALVGFGLADRARIRFDEGLGEWNEKRQRMPTGGLFE